MPYSSRPVHEVKAALFRVLGHPTRVRILELLRDTELSVGTLQAELGLDSGGTSQHLAALRRTVSSSRGARERASTTASMIRASSTCSLRDATSSAVRLAEQQSILHELETT